MPETTQIETPAESAVPVVEESLVGEGLLGEGLVEESLVEEVSIDGMCGVY